MHRSSSISISTESSMIRYDVKLSDFFLAPDLFIELFSGDVARTGQEKDQVHDDEEFILPA